MSDKKLLAIVVSYNTDTNTKILLSRFPKHNGFDILVINDGSVDRTQEYVDLSGFKTIAHPRNKGVGAAIKTGIKYAIENGYYAVAVIAGNNKDNPDEISKIFRPIIEQDYDYVQGSRFLAGGRWDNLPFFRYSMIKIHAFLFTVLTGKKCTDALNGFRSYRLSIFNDPSINIWQDWLDRYEFETYLHYRALKGGYRFKEVPVCKLYPKNKNVKYSHIRPIVDWWSILKPLPYLMIGFRR